MKTEKNQLAIYFLFLIILIIITIIGYFIFLKFVTTKDFGTLSIFIVALVAGVATFFSPCSFALLPGYLSFYTGQVREAKLSKSLFYGFIAALGLILFNVILAIIIGSIGLSIGKEFSISADGKLSGISLTIRVIVGLLLIFLGSAQLFHLQLFVKLQRSFVPKKKSLSSLFAYGFGYNTANLGCTGPILAGLIVLTLPSGLFNVIAAFLVYSLTMGILMISVSVISGVAKERVEKLAEITPKIQKISAIVLIIVGIFILLTVIFSDIFAKLFFP